MARDRLPALNRAVEENLEEAIDHFRDRLDEVWDRLAEKGQLDGRGGAEWRRVMRHVTASLTDSRALEKALLTWSASAE